MRHVFGWNSTIWSHMYEGHAFQQAIGIIPTLLRPKSRGSVTLGGPSIHDPPIIDTNFLDHPDDIGTLVEGMKFVKKMEETEAFKKHDIKLLHDKLLCGGNHHEPFTDAYYDCFVREYTNTVYHPVSTCAMGPLGKNSVVDSRLRVHGVGKLRVVDGSIMPKLVGANTNAACLMIGERGAFMILEDLDGSARRAKSKTEKDIKEEL